MGNGGEEVQVGVFGVGQMWVYYGEWGWVGSIDELVYLVSVGG